MSQLISEINLLKGLIIDGVHKAQSGHPGGAMSSSDFGYILFKEFLRYDPDDPEWLGRDRFVLSPGHESMLLYGLLHLVGWVPMDEIKAFRQLGSMTPGHPENFLTSGVECTTGPLGQGAAMSVGMAVAAHMHGEKLGQDIVPSQIYALVSDGDIQEGVCLGAASLAGHLQLSRLVWFYDSNQVQLSGPVAEATSNNEKKVFEGFGWQVIEIDGHDHEEIRRALRAAETSRQPTLIIGTTTIAKGCVTMENSAKTHGAPLPDKERLETKKALGIPDGEEFYCPEELYASFRARQGSLRQERAAWNRKVEELLASSSKEAIYFKKCFHGQDLASVPKVAWDDTGALATRNAFGRIIAEWAEVIPNLVGGSADLEPSNMTAAFAEAVHTFSPDCRLGRNIDFGVREFPMSALCNGLALFGGIIPFDATFLAFADYSRPALRLGAIQRVRVIHEFTHDSFYLGEDGPTHQPVEQVMSLRLIPDFYVMRPADAQETEWLMKEALQLSQPSAFCLTRQKLAFLPGIKEADVRRGGYIIHAHEAPEMIIFATGSEVHLALSVAKHLKANVVSLPCWELFDEQDGDYQRQVLRPDISKRISIEAGVTTGWQAYTGLDGLNIGLDRFGASAPAEDLENAFGFTPENVLKRIEAWL